ncbi:MAG: 4Fe-4S binding protein [Cyanobacteriota bacterium erpe_2018_sw_21hr_WHONDRS-SW48-000092_B_bin.40]|nr:4Fe-4S binding protein [Cyanobacteriota bacterium erpe_2018_sw_21hr_WHONDRS-SW48-000092_B_bin.40]
MLRLINYLLKQGVATAKNICPDLAEGVRGLPMLTDTPCQSGCSACVEICPTEAISVFKIDDKNNVRLDLGSCIGCGYCVDVCPTGTIQNNPTTRVAVRTREELILTTAGASAEAANKEIVLQGRTSSKIPKADSLDKAHWFSRSVAARVVSTGCSACDMELGAAGNPIFDIERFGVHIVASPRFADALIITGPVSKGMQEALVSCYGAMSSPRVVVALGTCAISGGVHKGGYAEANGVENILPVNVYIPGCPPHPWSIIHGMLLAMGKEHLAPAPKK